MVTKVYGIKNCDTIKKARRWLEGNNIEYEFHDYRVDGINRKMLSNWLQQLQWEELLNKRGTTWRKLPEQEKEAINKSKAIGLMLEQPAIIKRPVLTVGKQILVGFNETDYRKIFS